MFPLIFPFTKHFLVSLHSLSFLSISSAPMYWVTNTHLGWLQVLRTQKFVCPWSLGVVSGVENVQQRNVESKIGWQEWWTQIEQSEKIGSEKKVRMLFVQESESELEQILEGTESWGRKLCINLGNSVPWNWNRKAEGKDSLCGKRAVCVEQNLREKRMRWRVAGGDEGIKNKK